MLKRTCYECLYPFATDNPKSRICWECSRVLLVKKHPELAMHDAKLAKLAFDNGILVRIEPDGSLKVTDLFEYQDGDERWRGDLNKIRQRARRRGKFIPYSRAWQIAAKVAAKRAAAKYRDPKDVIQKRKRENELNGEV